MVSKERLTNNLLSSLSGILIFISVEHFIDLNGYTTFAPIIILAGVGLLLHTEDILKLKKKSIVTKPILITVSYVLIFIGSKVYLDQYIEPYWIMYFVMGIILLNNHQTIAERLFRGN